MTDKNPGRVCGCQRKDWSQKVEGLGSLSFTYSFKTFPLYIPEMGLFHDSPKIVFFTDNLLYLSNFYCCCSVVSIQIKLFP